MKSFPIYNSKKITLLPRAVYSLLVWSAQTRKKHKGKLLTATQIRRKLRLPYSTLRRVKSVLRSYNLITQSKRRWVPVQPPAELFEYSGGIPTYQKCLYPFEGLTLHQVAILSQFAFHKLPSNCIPSVLAFRLGVHRKTVTETMRLLRSIGLLKENGAVRLPDGEPQKESPKTQKTVTPQTQPNGQAGENEKEYVISHYAKIAKKDAYNLADFSIQDAAKEFVSVGYSQGQVWHLLADCIEKLFAMFDNKECTILQLVAASVTLYRQSAAITAKLKERKPFPEKAPDLPLAKHIIWTDFISPNLS